MRNTNRTIDYLIIGQGLAGSVLAWLLIEQNQRILVVDDGRKDSASRVAAGIVNPLAGKRLVMHPATVAQLKSARSFYSLLEDCLKQSFYFDRPMIRLFGSETERKTWTDRQRDPDYSNIVGEAFAAGHIWAVPANRLGGFHQKNCGFLDTRRFLDSLRDRFLSNHRLIETGFEWTALERRPGVFVWNNFEIRNIICCEGYRAIHNPYFCRLPFQFSKGELATFESDTDLPDAIVNCGKWILPMNARRFKCGATYDWESLNSEPSAHARAQLWENARKLLPEKTSYRLLAQEAGIRPGTLDKQPFIGWHPKHPRIGIFNGFGSKGVLSIPYYANLFVGHLLSHKPLPEEIAVGRYPRDETPG